MGGDRVEMAGTQSYTLHGNQQYGFHNTVLSLILDKLPRSPALEQQVCLANNHYLMMQLSVQTYMIETTHDLLQTSTEFKCLVMIVHEH